jgi:hypothetical protein
VSGLAGRNVPHRVRYPIDIVFVVDATESMGPLLDTVKFHILQLESDLRAKLQESGKDIESLRARLIAFRDIIDHPESAIVATDFFDLPAQQEAFEAEIKGIRPFGGADAPESGLEALFIAMRSEWRREPRDLKRRHIIMLFTDQEAHPIGEVRIPLRYANEPHPKSMADLKRLWGPPSEQALMSSRFRRLVLFAPHSVEIEGRQVETHWAQIAHEWEEVAQYQVTFQGLEDVRWTQIIQALVATV